MGNANSLSGLVSGLVNEYLQNRDYRAAYNAALRAAADARLKATNALVYIAHQIANTEIDGVNDEDRVDFFPAFVHLYEAVHEIREELCRRTGEVREVAHYASLDALKALAPSDARFHLYNVDHMNDPEEGRVFFDVMNKPDIKKRFYSDLVAGSGGMRDPLPAYIGSFVEAGTKAPKERLFLWRLYGKHSGVEAGGACMIFDREKFAKTAPEPFGGMSQRSVVDGVLPFDANLPSGGVQSMQPPAEPDHPAKPALYRVIYESDLTGRNKSAREMVSLLNRLATELAGVQDALDRKASDKLDFLVREMLDGARFLFKADHHREEKEVRVLEMRYGAEEKYGVKIDGNRFPPRLHLEIENFRFHEVILGVNVDDPLAWRWYVEHADKTLEVVKSGIGFRR